MRKAEESHFCKKGRCGCYNQDIDNNSYIFFKDDFNKFLQELKGAEK